MFEIMPAWLWIAIILCVMGAAALFVDQFNKRVQRFVMDSAQSLTDALEAHRKTDNEFRTWGREALETLEAQCRSLLDKSEELYEHNRKKVREVWARVGAILHEKGLK